MAWVQTDAVFSRHGVIFQMTRMDILTWGEHQLMQTIRESAVEPDELESLCRELLNAFRPALAEASIAWMNFDCQQQCLEIGVTHPSLPAVCDGAEYKRVPLDPQVEKRMYDEVLM